MWSKDANISIHTKSPRDPQTLITAGKNRNVAPASHRRSSCRCTKSLGKNPLAIPHEPGSCSFLFATCLHPKLACGSHRSDLWVPPVRPVCLRFTKSYLDFTIGYVSSSISKSICGTFKSESGWGRYDFSKIYTPDALAWPVPLTGRTGASPIPSQIEESW
jgi:hypothetical protein